MYFLLNLVEEMTPLSTVPNRSQRAIQGTLPHNFLGRVAAIGGMLRFPVLRDLRSHATNAVVGHPITVATNRKAPRGVRSSDLRFSIQTDREDDGRWVAEIPEVPGALAYGATVDEAIAKAYAIALRTVADEVESCKEEPPTSINFSRAIALVSGQALRRTAY